jgi:hypothetical protein
VANVLKNAVAKRLGGDRPSPVQALGASIVAGVAVAVITYRVMRS